MRRAGASIVRWPVAFTGPRTRSRAPGALRTATTIGCKGLLDQTIRGGIHKSQPAIHLPDHRRYQFDEPTVGSEHLTGVPQHGGGNPYQAENVDNNLGFDLGFLTLQRIAIAARQLSVD